MAAAVAMGGRWWLATTVLGLLAWPWVARLLPRAPGRGYAQARLAATLALAGAYGWTTIVGRAANSAATLYAVAAGLAALGALGAWLGRRELAAAWRQDWRHLLTVELLYGGVLAAAGLYKAFTPAIVHTEQPMDFAFLNAMWQSPYLPPQDPWMAGEPISYYYLGYLALALPARLAGIPAAVAYNLGLAHTAALAAAGSYGVLAALSGAEGAKWRRAWRGLPVIGALALVLAGSPAAIADLWRALRTGWWAVADTWWWWPASRVIQDGNFLGRDPTVITEFPAFSLVLGDLHPHYMALPLLALGVALLPEVARRARARAEGAAGSPLGGWAWGCAVALLLGAAGFLNSWDLPTLLALVVAAYGLFRWLPAASLARRARLRAAGPWLRDTLVVALWLGTLALAGYAPFYLDLHSQVQGISPADYARTALPAYVQALGIWLWPLLADLAADGRLLWARRRALLGRWALLFVAPWLVTLALWGLGAVLLGSVSQAMAGPWVPLLQAGLLAAWWVVLEEERRRGDASPARTLGRLLALAGVGLTYLAEFAYVTDLFHSRMNTVFKIYVQAWVFLGMAAVAAVARLIAAAQRRDASRTQRWPALAAVGLALLLAAGGWAYTGAAAFSRAAAAADSSAGSALTLDGSAAPAAASPGEMAAYRWLQANGRLGERLVEGVGTDYDAGSNRLSAWTGMPTILGWPGHELQWRGLAAANEIANRTQAVAWIYTSPDAGQVDALLADYGVTFLYVGPYERQKYGIDDARIAWYDEWLTPCFSAGDVRIWRRP